MAAPRVESYRAQVEARLGPCQFELGHRWVAGGAELWRVATPAAVYALKVYVAKDRYLQERRAYERWLTKLEAEAAAARQVVPHYEAAFDGEFGALLLSWVCGQIWLSGPAAVSELAVYENAGRCLSRLHAVSCPELAVADYRDRVRLKTIRRAEQLRAVIGERVFRWAVETAESADWDALEVGYCHRDYSPRNWLVDVTHELGQVTVIDFEHSEWDYRVTDVMKLWDDSFIGHPQRRRAFYAGYGCPAEQHLPALRLLAPSHGLAIVNWSHLANDAEYLAHGRTFLERCSSDPDWMQPEDSESNAGRK